MLDKILQKLIRTATGRTRFIMAVTGLSVALLLILMAVQLQTNYNELLNSKSNQDSIANFLVVNKQLNDQNLGATALTESEVAELRKQPFTESVGLLSPSRFKASIQSNSEMFPFYTDIAFESVPDEFIDVTSKDWKWDEQQNMVPVIVPNMFLDFYNFQFSFSQNLPQLTQQVVKMIVFRINIYTSTGIQTFNGRVVGFSDRISSLLVPQGFMDWANRKFSGENQAKPSRVIIRTNDPGNPELVSYLRSKGLTTDADKTRFSRYRQVVDMVVSISWITGVIMLVFAMLIFTLFIQLTISSCRREIELLITLGASPGQLYKFLMRRFFPINIVIIGITLVLISILQYLLHHYLISRNIHIGKYISWQTAVAGMLLLGLIWVVNRVTIKKYISVS
ncbi:FtsX-like permease family protein [Sediminibacterium ginsengisoli]|uniref:FtsX-like permease family protein n=1 Tax=Sediminibacterium ginsengisoli TaxID=413434 RepID=A0A1T4LV21_9BACT|nr:FtsX-like permease family protein [Sediminibacterium ginsengisoli]SJZ58497.1 FtsX-like permease family protein [Sediminibacterium ginsengisoli]